MDRERILASISSGAKEIGEAERHLGKVLLELRIAPRAEKTTISDEVQEAFDRLRNARINLEALERLVSGSE
jgi:hypothetical protein